MTTSPANDDDNSIQEKQWNDAKRVILILAVAGSVAAILVMWAYQAGF